MPNTKRTLSFAAVLAVLTLVVKAAAPEPIIGTWHLDKQEINGEKKELQPLTLRVTPDGDKLAFAFSIPVNNIDFVSMSYSAPLNGTEADVKNAQGAVVGAIQLTAAGHAHYKMILKGANRPRSTGELKVSPDGKTLTSESETPTPSGAVIRSVQVFSRQ